MTRIGSDIAAGLSGRLNKAAAGQPSGGRGTGPSVEVKDTVTISRQARELAAGGDVKPAKISNVKTNVSPAKPAINETITEVKKSTAALKTIQSPRMRLVLATGTILMPGKTTTVNLSG
ncbi:MAG: hypothetical protein GY950_14645 [bacterium]|nr:hypothetical protein [bacterium]